VNKVIDTLGKIRIFERLFAMLILDSKCHGKIPNFGGNIIIIRTLNTGTKYELLIDKNG